MKLAGKPGYNKHEVSQEFYDIVSSFFLTVICIGEENRWEPV